MRLWKIGEILKRQGVCRYITNWIKKSKQPLDNVEGNVKLIALSTQLCVWVYVEAIKTDALHLNSLHYKFSLEFLDNAFH